MVGHGLLAERAWTKMVREREEGEEREEKG